MPFVENAYQNLQVNLSQRSWFLYLIECSDGSIYTGVSVDVKKRYAKHASGKGARYTRSHPPRRLLVSVKYPDRSTALKAEYALKQKTPAQKRAFYLQITNPSGMPTNAAASGKIEP